MMIAEAAAAVAGAARAGDGMMSPAPLGGGAAATGWSWDAATYETICGRGTAAAAEDAAVALVRPGRTPRVCPTARAREWILSFVSPHRGGATDPRRCVELRFPSLDAAMRYARAQGLRVEVCGPATTGDDDARGAHRRRPAATSFAVPLEPPPRVLWWALDGRAPLPEDLLEAAEAPGGEGTTAAARGDADPDLEMALLDPAGAFRDPMEVVAHQRLTLAQKREILARWEWDARLIEVARAEGMPPDAGEPSRLEEVIAARRALEAQQVTRSPPLWAPPVPDAGRAQRPSRASPSTPGRLAA